jgi:hypothetical protein
VEVGRGVLQTLVGVVDKASKKPKYVVVMRPRTKALSSKHGRTHACKRKVVMRARKCKLGRK